MQNHQLSTAAMGAMRKGQVAFPVVSQWMNDVGSGAGYTLGLIAGEGAFGDFGITSALVRKDILPSESAA